MPVKKITCFTLGALAGALGMYAYREFRSAQELRDLRDLLPDLTFEPLSSEELSDLMRGLETTDPAGIGFQEDDWSGAGPGGLT